jgi:radical SAM superfamily enzyme YgiQ (UPF0313 family)
MKIFLADLVHTWEKVSLWTFPLNVGYIASYARANLDEPVEVRLFKRPDIMIDAIRAEKPDVVALAHYVWNTNLNNLVFRIAKRDNPYVLTVGGGPNFTSANADERHALDFFRKTPDCDAFVVNQGERGFLELMRRYLDVGGNLDRLRRDPVPGILTNDLSGAGRAHVGEALDVIRDLDEIPSPYLNHMLDEFFEEPFVPILETNRSCPYRCTFCAWGIGTGKLARFSDERVFAEIDYLGRNCTKSGNLFVADANFSILDRDRLIAARLRENHERSGFPGHVSCQWNKTRPDRVLEVARALGNLGEVGASMQTLDGDVLDAIKRRNLPLEAVAEMIKTLRAEGHETSLFSELILGLPNETRQGHIDANKRLTDLGAEVFNYNLHLLPGTEMDTVESRSAYFRRTGWRLHDNAFGVYDGEKVFEGQEVVLETNAMSIDDLRGFRFIHFLLQFMWGRKWYYDYLHLLKEAGVHPVDMVVYIAERFPGDDGEMGALYERFRADHELENFETFEALAEYWSDDDNLDRLRRGNYGKLNYLYTYEILLSHYEAFNEFLLKMAREKAATLGLDDEGGFADRCEEILAFSQELRISLSQSMDEVVARKRRQFRYNLLAWRESGYQGAPAPISTSDRFELEFFLPERQHRMLQTQLEQFRSHNQSLTLRKMSEEMSADDFFYRVRAVDDAT